MARSGDQWAAVARAPAAHPDLRVRVHRGRHCLRSRRAAIIHFHACDERTGLQNDDLETFARIIEGIRAVEDVIVYPPEPYARRSHLTLLAPEAPYPKRVAAGLGIGVTFLISKVVSSGGHIPVGLEDAPLGTDVRNASWVTQAARAINAAGGHIVSCRSPERDIISLEITGR